MTSWPSYYMQMAELAATKSKDPTKVGAVLVGEDGEIRLTAYNGPPKGVADDPERFERPAKYLFASHAESNLVAFAAREGIRTKGCSVYVTHHPCSACARSLIQAGIRCVVVGPGTTSMPNEEFEAAAVMFAEAGVETKKAAPPSSHAAVTDALVEKAAEAYWLEVYGRHRKSQRWPEDVHGGSARLFRDGCRAALIAALATTEGKDNG
ncbi:MAG: deoxycytidylate deaminase [Aquidulcibacter sp.]